MYFYSYLYIEVNKDLKMASSLLIPNFIPLYYPKQIQIYFICHKILTIKIKK